MSPCCGAIWRRREKPQYRCTTTVPQMHPCGVENLIFGLRVSLITAVCASRKPAGNKLTRSFDVCILFGRHFLGHRISNGSTWFIAVSLSDCCFKWSFRQILGIFGRVSRIMHYRKELFLGMQQQFSKFYIRHIRPPFKLSNAGDSPPEDLPRGFPPFANDIPRRRRHTPEIRSLPTIAVCSVRDKATWMQITAAWQPNGGMSTFY